MMTKEQELLEYIKHHFDTDLIESDGRFVWNVRGHGITVGREAGCINKEGYRVMGIQGKRFYAHRLAWLWVYGKFPSKEIDHINGNRLDNRIPNLRDVTKQENRKNQKIHKKNTSGVMGVYWSKDRKIWRVKISCNKKQLHIGCYKEFDDAVEARKEAERKYGFHPNHGRVVV